MSITNLIANAGRSGGSPVEAYMRGREFKEQSEGRQFARQMELAKQQEGQRRYALEQQQKQQKLIQENSIKYAEDITPALQDINELPESQRNAAYQELLPQLKAQAKVYGLPTDNISKDWDQQKYNVLEDRFGIEKFDPVYEDGKIVAQVSRKTGKRISDPTAAKKSEVLTGEMQKKTKGLIEKDIYTTADFLQNMGDLEDQINAMPAGNFTWGADLGEGVLKGFSRTFGVEYDGNMSEFMQNKQNVATYTQKLSDAYRKMITGSQANKFELQKIEKYMPKKDDSIGVIRDKISKLTEIAEIAQVRAKTLASAGFVYKRRDNGELVYENKRTGDTVKYSQIEGLGDIKTHKEQREIIKNTLLEQNPDLDKRSVVEMTTNAMRDMGYYMKKEDEWLSRNGR